MLDRLTRLLRLDRRRRFRDRVLVGMLVVALGPLAALAAVVVVDLGRISQSTVDATHRTILQDQEERQQGLVANQAELVDLQLGGIANEVQQLRDQVAAVLMPQTSPAAPGGAAASQTLPFNDYRGAYFAETPDGASSVIVGQLSHLVLGGALDGRNRYSQIAAPTAPFIPFMQGMRKGFPQIEAVWIVDKTDYVIRTVPAMDVAAAINEKRLDPDAPLGQGGDVVFSSSQKRMAATQAEPEAWSDPSKPQPRSPASAGPFWTDPYQTRQDRQGEEGVTVWVPVGDGRTLVGADISVNALADSLLPPTLAGEPNAYPMLLSSSNKLLAAGDLALRDFGLPQQQWVGTPLPFPGSSGVGPGLSRVERSGHAQTVRATLSGTDKEIFTAPVYTAHWVLAAAVPVVDLEPDVSGLTRGIQSGIGQIISHVIPLALLLCLVAALLANLLARRLVGPVRALTVAAERLADGATEEAVPPQGADEVGLLASSLERMRREVNASRDAILAAARELEGRVADRTAELRTRNEELVALNALAGSLTRSLDPRTILDDALRAMAAILPLTAAAGYCLQEGLPAALATTGDDDPATARRLGEAARAALAAHDVVTVPDGDRMLVAIPLETGGRDLGAMVALTQPGAPVGERTRALLDAVADQVGLALRTAELSEEGRELAVLEERTRLAREIHDTLAQQLTAIVLQLEAAEAFVERDGGGSARSRDVVVAARDLARSALQEARRSVWNLRPAPLVETGLVGALSLEVRRWQTRTGIAARVRTHRMRVPPALPPQAEVALFRIVQEALSNVAQHSGARHVTVRLAPTEDTLELTVQDDGAGFTPDTAPRHGSFGLMGMAERARLAGGTLDIESRPGHGTRVVVRLPLAEGAPVATPA